MNALPAVFPHAVVEWHPLAMTTSSSGRKDDFEARAAALREAAARRASSVMPYDRERLRRQTEGWSSARLKGARAWHWFRGEIPRLCRRLVARRWPALLMPTVVLFLAIVWLGALVWLFFPPQPPDPTTEAAEAARQTAIAHRLEVLAFLGIFTAPLLFWRSYTAHQQAETARRQADTAEQGHITERFTKAIEQLGATRETEAPTASGPMRRETRPALEIRLGAIYALERIAQDSLRDHWMIMETLQAYIRHNRPVVEDDEDDNGEVHAPPREDVQAALTVIARRTARGRDYEKKHGLLVDWSQLNACGAKLSRSIQSPDNFHMARFSGIELREANLSNSVFTHANLRNADLYKSDLSQSDLAYAKMSDSALILANFDSSSMPYVNMDNASGMEATFRGANLGLASIRAVSFGGSDFCNANLTGANFSPVEPKKSPHPTFNVSFLNESKFCSSRLDAADFTAAKLVGADFRRAGLTHTRFKGADLSGAKFEGATIEATDFTDANLEGAKIHGWNLQSYIGLTQEQIDSADHSPPDEDEDIPF